MRTTDQAVQANTYSYTYAESFGTPDKQGTQEAVDKQVLKALTQNNKESLLSFKSLLKKIKQETERTMQLDKPRKDTLSQNLERTQYSNHYTEYRHTPYTGQNYSYQEGIQEALLLDGTQYSDLRTRQEHTVYTLHIRRTQYREDCTLVPVCSDCTNNGLYSTCEHRKPVKHTHTVTIPFNQFWHYALLGTRP